MHLEGAELYETDAALIARLLAQTPFAGDFADLSQLGTVMLFPEPRIQFEAGRFATPSGKIEIASERATIQELPRLPEPRATRCCWSTAMAAFR